MFKSARWRSEKNKVKAVFRLQFHAAQISQVGSDALIISVVPADTGKPTVKSEKALIRDGSCFWENPIYETVKFNRDAKSGKFHERIYYFIVGTGLSKGGGVGEASIDFSLYAEASKVSLVSLPIEKSQTEGGVLHVSIQRIQESTDQRDAEESENGKLNTKDHSFGAQLTQTDANGTDKTDSIEDAQFHKAVEFNEPCHASCESDLTISSSESSSGIETPRIKNIKNRNIIRSKSDAPIFEEHQKSPSNWEWLENCAADDSLRGRLEENLKSEITALSRQAEMSELELQTLRKQIVKESKRGQDLSREIATLREEKTALMEQFEKLRDSKINSSFEGGDRKSLVQELRQELNHANELNANLRIQLQKTQESNSELILAVRDLDEILEKKNNQEVDPTTCDQKVLEGPEKTHLLEQEILQLRGEIESYRREKDELEMQMEQLVLDYEIMKQENHEFSYKLEQSQIQEQLKMQYECSSSFATAQELESHIEMLENELNIRARESDNSLVKISQLESKIVILEDELNNRSKESAPSKVSDLESQIEFLKNELNIRSKESVDSLSKVSELESQIEILENELDIRSKESNDSLSEVRELESQIEILENELDIRSKESADSQSKVSELKSLIENLENELDIRSKESSNYISKISELESGIELLENELDIRSKESTDSLSKISELESHVKNLEEEIEIQAQGFESDLDSLTRSKIEQEQRAIRAEEILRKTRWQNGKTAEKIQEEFRRLSEQMGSTFEANEKLATKAFAEANELRIKKAQLEEMHKSAREEIVMYKEKNKTLLKDIEEMRKTTNNKSAELDKAKNEALGWKNELDKLRGLLEEKEVSLMEDKLEKEKLKKQVFQLKSDLKKTEETLNSVEKKMKENVRGTTFDAVRTTSKIGKAGPAPRGSKEVVNLKERIKLLEGQILLKETALEKSSNSFSEREKDLYRKIEELEERLEVINHSSDRISENEEAKKATNQRLHEESINGDANSNTMTKMSNGKNDANLSETLKDSTEKIDEIALLKQMNRSMEEELQELQERYSETSLKFAEVEGERQRLVMKLRNLKNANKSSS